MFSSNNHVWRSPKSQTSFNVNHPRCWCAMFSPPTRVFRYRWPYFHPVHIRMRCNTHSPRTTISTRRRQAPTKGQQWPKWPPVLLIRVVSTFSYNVLQEWWRPKIRPPDRQVHRLLSNIQYVFLFCIRMLEFGHIKYVLLFNCTRQQSISHSVPIGARGRPASVDMDGVVIEANDDSSPPLADEESPVYGDTVNHTSIVQSQPPHGVITNLKLPASHSASGNIFLFLFLL